MTDQFPTYYTLSCWTFEELTIKFNLSSDLRSRDVPVETPKTQAADFQDDIVSCETLEVNAIDIKAVSNNFVYNLISQIYHISIK